MLVASAIQLISSMVYKPGWIFEASDHTNRFEGTVKIKITYPARNSNQEDAPDYPNEIVSYASFPVVVADCDELGMYKRILDAIAEIEVHEAREFLRVGAGFWAPFHPHTIDGMKRWQKMTRRPMISDMQFGIA